MLLLLLSFYVHYGLINCEEIVKAKFNESSLVDHHRRILLQVNSLLQDLEQKPGKLSVFKADNYENNLIREEFIYKKVSSALRSDISGIDQNYQSLKTATEPPPVILESLRYARLVPLQHFPGSSSVMSPDLNGPLNNPDDATESPSPQYARLVTLRNLQGTPAPQSAMSPDPNGPVNNPDDATEPPSPQYARLVTLGNLQGTHAPQSVMSSDPNGPLNNPDDATEAPSPQYARLVTLGNLQGTPAPQSVIPPDPTGQVKNQDKTTEPHYPGHQLIPINSIYPGLMMPSCIFSINCSSQYVANYSYLSSFFKPGEQVLYQQPPFINLIHIIPVRPINVSRPSSPKIYVSEYRPLHDSTLTTTIRTTIGAHAKIWLQEIAPYTRKKKTKKGSVDQSRLYTHMGTTVPIPPRMIEPRNYWSLTGKPNTAEMFNKGDYGVLQVALAKFDVRPGTIHEGPNKNWMTTPAAGDVLYGKIKVQKPSTMQAPEQRHLDLMVELEEGYLMVFVIELFRLIAVKDKREVQEVLAPMGTIYESLSKNGRLAWVDDPLLIFIEKLSNVASSGADGINIIRTYSSMMFHTLLKRKEVLSPEVNSIIDQAELFYSDEEGKRLLRSLTQFEDYPNTVKGSYWICQSLIENILQPFRRPAVSRSRDRLLDSVNRALRRRFPLLRVRIKPKVGTTPSKIKRKHHHKKKRKRIYLKAEFHNK